MAKRQFKVTKPKQRTTTPKTKSVSPTNSNNSRKGLPRGFWSLFVAYGFFFMVIFTAIGGVYLRFFPYNERLTTFKQAILARPHEVDHYLALAEYYSKRGLAAEAEYEFAAAKSIDPSKATATEQELLLSHAEIENHITYWKELLIQYPDYRDAQLKLALLYYQLNDVNTANEYLNQAGKIDLNNEKYVRIKEALQN